MKKNTPGFLKSPILVTGSHRSGSTWTGKVLAFSKEIAYVHEPFNLFHRKGICSANFENWYTFISRKNEEEYLISFNDLFHLNYNFSAEIKTFQFKSIVKDILRLARDSSRFSYNKLNGKRLLIKDPIALFSSPWLAEKYQTKVVILIRHPAAFCGSIKRLNSDFHFSQWLNQPLLMKELLSEYRDQFYNFDYENSDIIDKAILMWNVFHSIIHQYQQKHKDWIFVRHEDLSRNPLEQFQLLYKKLNLKYTDNIQKKIIKSTTAENSKVLKGTQDTLIRNSRQNIQTWKKRLSEEDISRIKKGTMKVAGYYYTDEDW